MFHRELVTKVCVEPTYRDKWLTLWAKMAVPRFSTQRTFSAQQTSPERLLHRSPHELRWVLGPQRWVRQYRAPSGLWYTHARGKKVNSYSHNSNNHCLTIRRVIFVVEPVVKSRNQRSYWGEGLGDIREAWYKERGLARQGKMPEPFR